MNKMKFSSILVSLTLPFSVNAQVLCSKVLQSTAAQTEQAQTAHIFEYNKEKKEFVFPLTRSQKINQIISEKFLKALGVQNLNRITELFLKDTSSDPYFQRLARAFELKVDENSSFKESLARIPKTGPIIFTMNHPLNGSEGITLASEISKIRPDLKVVLTYFLRDYPGMSEDAIFLNPYGTEEARIENRKTMDEVIVPHLKAGHSLIIFPAGEVSKKESLDEQPLDSEWKKGTSFAIEQVPEAKVIPVLINEEASPTFYKMRMRADWPVIGKLFWGLIPAVHIQEIAHNFGRTLQVAMGFPLDASRLVSRFRGDDGKLDRVRLMGYLKSLTFSMRDRMATPSDERKLDKIWYPQDEVQHRDAIAADLLRANPVPQQGKGGIDLYLVNGQAHAPAVFLEIGRLREKVFREVGEGSGRSLDLDNNDPFYEHFVAFDSKNKSILGSYRMGRLDKLAAAHRAGYNESLFTYSAELSEKLNKQGLEFGRSFIDKSAGKKALLAFYGLWQRIGAFVGANPHYRYLTGPVSISNTYSSTAKKMMVAFLKKNFSAPPGLAKAKVPYEDQMTDVEKELFSTIHTMDDLRQTVLALDGQEIPPLLSIYSSMNAKYLDFSVDHSFNTVDGMILVDLHDMIGNPALQAEVGKYLTPEGVVEYLRQAGH